MKCCGSLDQKFRSRGKIQAVCTLQALNSRDFSGVKSSAAWYLPRYILDATDGLTSRTRSGCFWHFLGSFIRFLVFLMSSFWYHISFANCHFWECTLNIRIYRIAQIIVRRSVSRIWKISERLSKLFGFWHAIIWFWNAWRYPKFHPPPDVERRQWCWRQRGRWHIM